MSLPEIDYYLNHILASHLYQEGLNHIDKLIKRIREQMVSLLMEWDNPTNRNGLLLVAREEALIYPKGSADIKAFVIVTLRNSPLESASSDFYQQAGFDRQIANPYSYVEEAIAHFQNVPLEQIAKQIPKGESIYQKAMEQYPSAWAALRECANMQALTQKYVAVTPRSTPLASNHTGQKNNHLISEEDGYQAVISEELSQVLEMITKENNNNFFSPNFKMITRNFDKLLRIMEYLFAHEDRLVTINYYMTNGVVSKRKNLLPPIHNTNELKSQLENTSGLVKQHRLILQDYRKKAF